jgi:hypothetical protein
MAGLRSTRWAASRAAHFLYFISLSLVIYQLQNMNLNQTVLKTERHRNEKIKAHKIPVHYCAAEAIYCCPTENSHHLEA